MNKVMLIGNLGNDPEVRALEFGKVVKFPLATSEQFTNKDGQRVERTEWHNVVIFNENLGRIAEQYLRKGGQAYIEGQLQTRKWQDQSGNDRYTTEIVLQRYRGELTLLGGRGDSGGGGYVDQSAPSSIGSSAPASPAPSRGQPPMGNDLDDDIPF